MKIDLVTGFLGSGKTTFIRMYAKHLIEKGENICILENDHGAVNVDMMFLQDLLGEHCELEMVIGGDGHEAHMRRFRTKLISMAMMGYDRVIVEPSGVYDVDEFFDTLREEPLDRWYEPGNVIAIVSAAIDAELSDESSYLLASQIANAGCVLLSKVQCVSDEKVREVSELLNGIMERFHCSRRFTDDLIAVNWNKDGALDLDAVSRCGYRLEDHIKYQVEKENHFSSLFYFYVSMDENEIRSAVEHIFGDPGCGRVHRIKGFVRLGKDKWIRINADTLNREFELTQSGQGAVIVIGEDLNRDAVDRYLKASSKFSGELDH